MQHVELCVQQLLMNSRQSSFENNAQQTFCLVFTFSVADSTRLGKY